ncbi:hypothetical protein HK096_008154 [Nowakowskiella sp. JEL0078]|nr:hypothetical protein HK096_008154 [Nowakowskiella sp. JEL0078]
MTKNQGSIYFAMKNSPYPSSAFIYIKKSYSFSASDLARSLVIFNGFLNITIAEDSFVVHFESIDYARRAWEISGLISTNATISKPSISFEDGLKNQIQPNAIENRQIASKNISAYSNSKSNRVTLHITGISMDMADLKRYFSSLIGFTKIDFHSGASCYVCFVDFASASGSIDVIHQNNILTGGSMRATFDVTYTPFCTRPSANPPNSVLHVTIYPSNAPHPDIAKILQSYEGFERAIFENGSCLAYFRDIDCAKRSLEDLNTTTNLVTNYTRKEPKQFLGGCTMGGFLRRPDDQQPKTTIQITNITMDRADLRAFIVNSSGFKKIAFYRDWCFVCFSDIDSASKSIENIHQTTKMRATFTKVEYSQKYTPHNVGRPNPTLYVNNLPFNATTSEFTKLFAMYDGFRDAYFFRGSCKVYFLDTNFSTRALEDLNRSTNLIATYYHGTNRTGSVGTVPMGHLNYGFPTIEDLSLAWGGDIQDTVQYFETQKNMKISEHALKQQYRQLQIRNQLQQMVGGENLQQNFPGQMKSSQYIQPAAQFLLRKQIYSPAIDMQIPFDVMQNLDMKSVICVTELSIDKADLKFLFQLFDGFERVDFHQDFCFVYFSSIGYSLVGVKRITHTTSMKAYFARDENVEASKNATIAQLTRFESGPPSPVLVLFSFQWNFSNLELTKIFRAYPGFCEIQFLQETCRIYYADAICANHTMVDLNKTTNLIVRFFGTSVEFPGNSAFKINTPIFSTPNNSFEVDKIPVFPLVNAQIEPSSKIIVIIGNVEQPQKEALKIFFKSIHGFCNVNFQSNLARVEFASTVYAATAIDIIQKTSKMSASFAKIENSPNSQLHFDKNSKKPLNFIKVRVNQQQWKITELTTCLSNLTGFVNLHLPKNQLSSELECFVQFISEHACTQALEGLKLVPHLLTEVIHAPTLTATVNPKIVVENQKDELGAATNVLKVLNVTPIDHGKIRTLVSSLNGFRAVAFRDDQISIRFENSETASHAIEQIKTCLLLQCPQDGKNTLQIDSMSETELNGISNSQQFDDSNMDRTGEETLTQNSDDTSKVANEDASLTKLFGNLTLFQDETDFAQNTHNSHGPAFASSIWTPLQTVNGSESESLLRRNESNETVGSDRRSTPIDASAYRRNFYIKNTTSTTTGSMMALAPAAENNIANLNNPGNVLTSAQISISHKEDNQLVDVWSSILSPVGTPKNDINDSKNSKIKYFSSQTDRNCEIDPRKPSLSFLQESLIEGTD